jgi:hypothetical protein
LVLAGQLVGVLDVEIPFEHFINDQVGFFPFNEGALPFVVPDIENFFKMLAERGIPATGKGIVEDERLAGGFFVQGKARLHLFRSSSG